MAQDNITNLYRAISGQYDLGTEEQFRTSLKDANARKNLYKALSNNFELGSEDDFNTSLGYGKQQQTAQAEVQPQQPIAVTSQPSNPQPIQTPQGFGQRDQNLTRQMSLGKGPVSWEQPQQEPKQETDFDKAMRVTRGQGTEAENKQVQKRLQQRQDAITYKQETGDENGMNGDLLRQKVLNPQWEAATLSRDEYGNLRRGDDGKLLTGFSTDQDVVAASKQINDELASQQLALTKEEQAEVKLNEAYEERKKLQDEMAKLYQASLVDGNSKGAEDALNMLASAARQNEKSIIALEAEMADHGQGQFWQGFIDAAKDADTYTFGVTGLVDAGRLMSIKNKMDNGEQLTDAEQRLLQNTNLNNIAQSEFGSNRGALYRFGGISMQALPFIAEFMGTGGFSALGNATTKGFTSMFGKYASKKFIQNTGIALGDIVAATAMANTTGAARTYSDIINRNIGDVVRDEKGNYAFEGGVGLGEAFYKGQVANTLEYYTEKLGEHLKLGQWLAKGADKAGLSKLSKAISYVSKNPWLERGGVQDYPSEVVEEQANLLLNAMLVGDNTFGSPDDPKSVINPETQTDIWGGMLFSIGLMQGPRFINTGRKYAGYKMYQTATNAASSRAEDVFSPDKWQAVKNQIDNTENQNLSEVLSQVITGNMTQEQKEATMYYADNLLKMRGYNVSLMNDLRDRDEDIAERGLNNSYMQGYNAKEPAQRQQINDAVAQSEAELSKYGNSFVYLVTDESHNPMAVLDFMSNNRTFFTDQQIQAATAYYMAKSSQQGVEDSDKEDADLAEASKSSRVSYTLKEQRVGGKWVVNSFDSKGNLIRSEEFDTKDDTDAFIGRVKMEQQMRAFNDYLNTQEVINNPQAIADFEAQNGWEPGTVANLAKSDPFRMSDEEWQMADQARDFLKGIAYPSTELHTETSAQDGVDTAEAVVEQVLSPEEPIDPQNNAGKEIREQFQAAEAALNQMFANDKTGDIEDHISSMKDSSPQEILSSLDTFRPEQRQVLIDYFNAKAKYDAFMNVAANKINEEAANSRQRHTFKGAIDGQADLNHVHTITDGTNRYYLVSGDITTDPATGQITGSTSGLIIGMDLDGSFVQLNESDGYSVDPVNMSLDQFEEAERIRLQEAVSLTIDPNGAAQAAAGQAQQSGNLDNAGGEAGTDNGTGANNPPATAPVAENTNQGTQQPAVTIESVTDKDGIKRYENGISVDDAIADIQNDGFDVNEISDASIAEAQQTIDKIDKKQTKTRKDLMDKKKAQDVIDYYNGVKARWAEMNQPSESEETINNEPQQPAVTENVVPSQPKLTVEEQKQERIKALKAELGELFDDDFTKANDVYELVSMWVGRKRNLAWDDVNGKRGLQKELGWTRKIGGDTKFIETLLAKKGEGVGVDEFVHMVWESPENDVNGEKRFDTDAIKEALLDLLKSARSKSDVVDYALNTRIIAAEQALEAQQQMEQEMQEAGVVSSMVSPAETDWSQMPFPPTMTDEESANDDFAKWFDKDGNYTYKSNDTERELSESSGLVYESEQGGLQEGIGESESDNLQSRPPVSPSTEGNQSERRFDANREEETNIGPESGNTLDVGQRQAGRASEVQTPVGEEERGTAAEGANEPESQGSTGSAVDDYLQPRNAEEERIIANVLAQLQQEIGDAVEDANKARTELENARAKESERATDLFANDNALNQEGQLFDNSDMPVDNSVEGIERRTAPEREKLQEAVNQLNRLQSLEERNSRIRGALDNYRRQTSIEDTEERSKREKEQVENHKKKVHSKENLEFKKNELTERAKKLEAILKDHPTDMNAMKELIRLRNRIDEIDKELAQKIDTTDPIEAIEQAAQSFTEEQEEKKAYGADNKLVSKDRYEELKKRMRDKLLGQMNLGVDPEILAIGTEMAVYHIEAGARKFIDYATNMINDLGDAIRPYLKAFYEGARRLPEMSELSKEMDSVSDVDAFDVLNYDKQPANTVNVNKKEDNEAENVVSSQQNTEETVERKAEDADKYRAFSQAVANDMLNAMETGEKPYKSINDIRKKAKQIGLDVDDEGRTDILLQELVEDGLVSAARQYVNTYVMQQVLAGKSAQEVRSSRDLFNDIVKLYELQPSITQRSSNRIKMGQFSTPLPMSFVADVFATPSAGDVLEPTAGNGMMVFAVPESMVHANELDNTRLENLKAQKFKKVTNQDATQPFEGDEQYDAIIANPPFGSAPAKDYDGKSISGLAEQIALNALSKMKDDGKAAIIIGGNMEYADNGAIKNDKAFFTYLYDHYNVKGVIDMDGKLFSRQGTTFPTRMILIDGRRSEEERAQTKVYPPVLKDSPMKVKTFEELFDVAEEIRNDNRKTNGNEVLRTSESGGLLDHSNTPRNIDRGHHQAEHSQNDANGRGFGRRGSNGGVQKPSWGGVEQSAQPSRRGVLRPGNAGLFDTQASSSTQPFETRTDNGSVEVRGRGESDGRGGSEHNVGETGRARFEELQGERSEVRGVGSRGQLLGVPEQRTLTKEKLSYRPHNTSGSLDSVAPAAMVEAMDDMLKRIEKEHGNIETWLQSELGYDTLEELHNALAAEQVDSVAMAIYQMKHGQGMIIGDQTGVGKGRQMAALIRWAVRQGKKPIFVTQKSYLFSDIYRDLDDIGSGNLRPFIFNSDGAMVDNNGVVVYKPLSGPTQAKVFAGDELPEGYDYAVLTYSQMSKGDAISQEEAREAAKKNGGRAKKKDDKPKPTPKATFLRAIAKDNYILLDESHTAAGDSNQGAYFQSILKDAKAVTFASATYASRPDNMPLYAIRTAMSKAKVKADELIKIIEKGGVTLQEIMSRALTQAGQMVRRERDMSDVKTDWKTIDDPETVKKARDNYDKTIDAFNAIIDFQKTYVSGYLDKLSSDLADVAASAGMREGTEDLGIKNVPFASKTYNYTKQLMLALKVDAIVDEVVKEIEAGRKPVIALENTMGSMLDVYDYGDTITEKTFAASLLKGLRGTLRYTITDEDGNKVKKELSPSQLGPEGEAAYHKLEDFIRESTSGIFISPLDAITEKLQAKGYSVGELTGREDCAVLDENTGEYVKRKRTDKDKKKLARDFNNGLIDVLILNKAASTGISLHASERKSVKDKRQRSMIIAQPLSVIADYMQMIGRIDRTGQVHRGYYINLGLPVPAEGRFLMMLATKLKSLNANTTTSQESENNDVEAPDLLNKYGSQVVVEYLRDNPDVYVKMGQPLKDGAGAGASKLDVSRLDEYQAQEDDARKITGYVALLSTAEQDAFYDDVTRRYNELIKYLNDTGSNDLKISVLPLNARTIDREVSSEGTAPNSGNPFADNAYVEWVDMDILKKPMKAADVGKTIEQLNPDGRVEQILSTVKKETQEKLDKENARYEVAKAKAEEDIAAKAETINRQQKRTTEQKKEAISKYAAERRQNVEESHNNMVNKIDANNMRLEKYLNMFKVGDSVLVPDDLTTDTFLGSSNGIFCGFKTKDEGITPSTTLAVFATLDGRRKIEVKLSEWDALTRINNMTEQNWDAAHEVTLSNWDEKIPSSSRKHGYIMTGNILQAISDTNFQGHLVTFTDDKGNVRDGVLMPDKWEPSQLKGSTVPISARKERIINLPNKESVTSTDKRVTITRYWGFYTLEVPKSKKQGGEFYLDKTLLDLVDGNDFFSTSSKMRARVDNGNIEAVLDRLGEMSVTLPSDRKIEFNEEGDSPKRMITTSDPMEAINQAAESWRQSNGKTTTNSKLQEISDMVDSLASRDDLKGSAPTYTINSPQDLEALKDKVSRRVYREIERLYSDPDNGAAYIPRAGIVVVFEEHLEDAKEAEAAWWHEQTHSFWQKMPEDVRRKFGEACYEWLRVNRPDIFNHITKPGNYERYDWLNESCAFLIGNVVIESYGTEKFLNGNFVGNPEICNFANELRNNIKNGRQESKNAGNNQLRRIGEGKQTSATEVRGSSQQGQGWGDNVIRPEEESELPEDPIQAIEQSAKRWIKFRKEQKEGIEEIDRNSAKAVYHDRIDRASTMIQEASQDDMVTFKHGQNAIAKDKDIPDSQNAYQAMNLSYGRIYNQQEQFTDIYKRPLEETVYEVCKKMGWQSGDVDRYLFTKHGFERNRELFVRDWVKGQRKKNATYNDLDDEQQEAYDKIAERLEEQFEDGDITEEQKNKKLDQALNKLWQEQIDKFENSYVEAKEQAYQDLIEGKKTFPEYLEAIDNFIHDNVDENFNAEEHDASGFTEMFGKDFKEHDILDKLMADEQKMGKELMDKMWSQINLCSQLGLDKYRESGMISDQTYKRVTNMFHFYVPMRGYSNNASSEDHWQYMTVKDGASRLGGLLKNAAGRKSEAGYPLATLFAMTYKAISDGEQNMVKQKFYRLCQANPNDLVKINDTWAVLDPTTDEWITDYPKISEDMKPQEVEARTQEFYERMRQLELEGKAKKVKSDAKFDYKVDNEHKREHIVEVMMNGNRKTMIVMGNPRMAQAINGQLRYKHGDGPLDSFVADAKYYMQSVSTSYNVTFLGRNMARDWTHFGAILMAREGGKYELAAQGYYLEQLPKMISLFKKYRDGSLDMNNEMERDFKDFMDSGGITGFVHMKKVEELQRDIQKMISTPGKVKKVGSAFWDKTLGALEAANEAIENNARFATYRASRHVAGRTKARSAYDAKEVTVNFNKRGAGKNTAGFKTEQKRVARTAKIAGKTSQILLANKMFFNATVQAICNIFRNIRNSDGSINKSYVNKLVGYYAIPPFALGMLMPVINDLLYSYLAGGGDDDDPYANLPEWVRRKNLCIYTGWIPGCGKNDFLVIPMGQELAAFYSLGDMIAGYTFAPNLKPVDKDFMDEMIGFFNVFSPVDFETKVTSNYDPVHEVVGRVCSPLAPLVAVGENLSWTGRQIFRQDKYNGDENTPEYQMTYGNTNSAYISLSKWLNDVSGGDDVHAGWAQINPGAMQYMFEQYAGGPGKFFMNTGSAIRDAYNVIFTDEEPDFNIRKIEFARAFWQQGDERTEIYRTKAKYHKYQQEANKFAHDFNGYKRDADTNPDHYMKALEMASTKDRVRMELVKEADKVLKLINTAANQATGRDRKNLRALYNSQMQLVVEQLDKIGQIEE